MTAIDPHKSEREGKWLWVILWTGLIYSTAACVRPLCEYLRGLTMLNVTVTVALCLFLALFLGRLLAGFRDLTLPKKFLLVLTVSLYAAGMVILKIPEERIHLVQYGVLAYLVFKAFAVDLAPKQNFGLTFLVTLTLGWGDEIIQSFAPGRFYDNKDIILNGVSGILGLLLTFLRTSKGGR